jgi:hypothetical protein
MKSVRALTSERSRKCCKTFQSPACNLDRWTRVPPGGVQTQALAGSPQAGTVHANCVTSPSSKKVIVERLRLTDSLPSHLRPPMEALCLRSRTISMGLPEEPLAQIARARKKIAFSEKRLMLHTKHSVVWPVHT